VRCEWNGVASTCSTPAGIDLEDDSELARDVQQQARLGIGEADVVMLVVDARAGSAGRRRRAGEDAARADVPVVVVANKLDRPEDEYMSAELNKLGLGEPMPVSASHGLGSGDLLDRVVELLGDRAQPGEPDEATRVAVIGAPTPASPRWSTPFSAPSG